MSSASFDDAASQAEKKNKFIPKDFSTMRTSDGTFVPSSDNPSAMAKEQKVSYILDSVKPQVQ